MSDARRRLALVLCEGFHDRGFWAGALEHTGCRDLRSVAKLTSWGEDASKLGGGRFAYLDPRGGQIVVQPCGGDSKTLDAVVDHLSRIQTRPLSALVVHVDADGFKDESVESARRALEGRLRDGAQRIGQPGSASNSWTSIGAGRWRLDAFDLDAFAVVSSVVTAAAPGVPAQQCLERVVSTALARAYPTRAAHVAEWLRCRPDPPQTGDAKSHAWSYMAGWCAEEGIEFFLQDLWRQPQVLKHLKDALVGSNMLEALETLTGRTVGAVPSSP